MLGFAARQKGRRRGSENAVRAVNFAQFSTNWSPRVLKKAALRLQILSPISIWSTFTRKSGLMLETVALIDVL
jgi:hypothetical protein